MINCKHQGYEIPCEGDVRRTEHGMLCVAHGYRAFLKRRCGVEVEPDWYGVQSEGEDTMFGEQEGGE